MNDAVEEQKPAIRIRPSRDEDVVAMLAIYRNYIFTGVEPKARLESFEINADDLKRRRKNMRNSKMPHIAAEADGQVVGYAYVVPFRKRPAYRFTVKHSIYIHPDWLHAGLGKQLLNALMDACAAAGFRQMLGYVDSINEASIRLHVRCGFNEVGRLPAVAWKYDRWSDVVMMQRSLGEGLTSPPTG